MSRQLITFEIGDRRLGIDIMAIREIRAWSPTTPLPNVPAHVRGVVNLRGVVLPVIDLSQRLGWGTTEPSARHVIIVVRIGDQLLVGADRFLIMLGRGLEVVEAGVGRDLRSLPVHDAELKP